MVVNCPVTLFSGRARTRGAARTAPHSLTRCDPTRPRPETKARAELGALLQPMPLRPQRRGGPVGDADGLEHPRQMGLDGLLADAQLARDLLVGLAAGEEAE